MIAARKTHQSLIAAWLCLIALLTLGAMEMAGAFQPEHAEIPGTFRMNFETAPVEIGDACVVVIGAEQSCR